MSVTYEGERFYDWAFFTVTLPDEPPANGYEHTLLIRRSIADPTEVAYFLVHAPAATTMNAMVAVAGIRWRIEECNEQGKDLIGLNQHQVRTWTALHHHVAVCMFAHACLQAAGQTSGEAAGQSAGQGAHRGNDPAMSQSRPRPPAMASSTTSNGGN
jgi:SRSO17 transposase